MPTIDLNASRDEVYRKVAQALQSAIYDTRKTTAAEAGSGSYGLDGSTGELFVSNGSSWTKKNDFTVSTGTPPSTNTSSIFIGWDETSVSNAKRAKDMNSRNYRKFYKYDEGNGARITVVKGCWVNYSTSSSVSTVTVQIPDIGERTVVKYRVRSNTLIEDNVGTSSPSRTSFTARLSGISAYSGSDSGTRYWWVIYYEYETR